MLYLDASALVKRYVDEEGSDMVSTTMSEADAWFMCRIGFVEVARAVGLAGGRRASMAFAREWPAINVIEVDAELSDHAAELALSDDLRSLDALHLAAAMVLPAEEITLATWGQRLHRAACHRGLRVLPGALS